MTDVDLNPAHSRLALPGYMRARFVFCDGAKHECTILVNEHGEVVASSSTNVASNDYDLEKIGALSPSSQETVRAKIHAVTLASVP